MTHIRPQGCGGPGFWLVRDDLLHPVAGGNKLRKLDALLPQLQAAGATDIVRSLDCVNDSLFTACD